MASPDPSLAVSVLLHAGHEQVAFSTYLYRILAVLLAFAVLAVGTYRCLDVVGTTGTPSRPEGDAEEAES